MTNEPFTEETAGQIDPQNPFDNSLENPAYRTDYRRFLPQILLPGFQIPLFPERGERRNLRRQLNTAGAGVLLSSLGSQLLFRLLLFVLLLCMDGSVAAYFNGDQSGAMHAMLQSGIYMALHVLVFAGMNTLVAVMGCRRIRQPLRGLFQTADFSAWKAFQYICIGFGLQYATGIGYQGVKLLGQHWGLTFPEVSFNFFQTAQSALFALLYTCILAPITEELLFRGFLMKSLSAVSVRFGIVTSALLFGLSLFLSPIFLAIPSFATAPALIVVGFLMISSVLKVDFSDLCQGIPAFITLIAMPFMYSISEGIALGTISFVVINVLAGPEKRKAISPVMYVLAILFAAKYFVI